MDKQLFCKVKPLNKEECSLSSTEKFVRKNCNDFLKTCKGLSYLIMRYPNLSLQQAIEEYKVKSLQSTNF